MELLELVELIERDGDSLRLVETYADLWRLIEIHGDSLRLTETC